MRRKWLFPALLAEDPKKGFSTELLQGAAREQINWAALVKEVPGSAFTEPDFKALRKKSAAKRLKLRLVRIGNLLLFLALGVLFFYLSVGSGQAERFGDAAFYAALGAGVVFINLALFYSIWLLFKGRRRIQAINDDEAQEMEEQLKFARTQHREQIMHFREAERVRIEAIHALLRGDPEAVLREVYAMLGKLKYDQELLYFVGYTEARSLLVSVLFPGAGELAQRGAALDAYGVSILAFAARFLLDMAQLPPDVLKGIAFSIFVRDGQGGDLCVFSFDGQGERSLLPTIRQHFAGDANYATLAVGFSRLGATCGIDDNGIFQEVADVQGYRSTLYLDPENQGQVEDDDFWQGRADDPRMPIFLLPKGDDGGWN